jgi:hypothetical protein
MERAIPAESFWPAHGTVPSPSLYTLGADPLAVSYSLVCKNKSPLATIR